MEHNYKVIHKNICLIPLEHKHIEKLREWRNNKEQTKFLRDIGYVTSEMQEKWFEEYKTNKDIISFGIYETENLNCLIGSVSLYNFNKEEAEIGKIQIGDSRALGRGYGSKSFAMLLKFAFENLNLKRVVATVNINNISAQKSYFKLGFINLGEINNNGLLEFKIEINKEILKRHINYYDEIEVFS